MEATVTSPDSKSQAHKEQCPGHYGEERSDSQSSDSDSDSSSSAESSSDVTSSEFITQLRYYIHNTGNH